MPEGGLALIQLPVKDNQVVPGRFKLRIDADRLPQVLESGPGIPAFVFKQAKVVRNNRIAGVKATRLAKILHRFRGFPGAMQLNRGKTPRFRVQGFQSGRQAHGLDGGGRFPSALPVGGQTERAHG